MLSILDMAHADIIRGKSNPGSIRVSYGVMDLILEVRKVPGATFNAFMGVEPILNA